MSEQVDIAADDAEFQAKRAAKRAAFPSVTAIVDEFRVYFGEGVRALGGRDFVTGMETGWNPPPSPNCDSCTGHDGGPTCDRMDRVAYGHDKPEPGKVFCGYRLRKAPVIENKRERR
jgi:hypothetical protein